MSHPFGRLILGLACCFTTLFAAAQEVSPYSRYGLGDVQTTDFSAAKAMGGVSATYNSVLQPNYSNPASYSSVSLSTFEVGLSYGTKTLKLRDTTFKAGDAFLDYLAISLPVGKRAGISAGLVPFSKMDYNFSQSQTDTNVGSYKRLFTGNGRTYEAYIGGAYRVVGKDTSRHNLSIGLNTNVLFGKLLYSEALYFPDSNNALSSRRNVETHVTDIIFDLGFQWKIRLNKLDSFMVNNVRRAKPNTFITIGGYARLPINRAATIEETYDRLTTTGGTVSVIDTLSFSAVDHRKLNTPPKVGFGIALSRGFNWTVGVDASYTMWSSFKDVNETVNFRNDIRLAVGAEIRPKNAKEKRNFLARTYYRLGGYYDNGYLTLNGQDIKEYGFTFGLGIPLPSENRVYGLKFPFLNVSFDVGTRGTNSANLIQETYFKGTISLTLNGKWFEPRKYD